MKDVQATTSSETSSSTAQPEAWRGFQPSLWQRDINVRWFIQRNYTPDEGLEQMQKTINERDKKIQEVEKAQRKAAPAPTPEEITEPASPVAFGLNFFGPSK